MPEIEESKTFKKQLPVDLSDAEVRAKTKKNGKLQRQIDELTQKMNDSIAGHRKDLKEMKAKLRGAMYDQESCTEERAVDCVEKRNYTTRKATTVRLDTGAEVETRTMSAEETQKDWVADGGGVPSVADAPPADKKARKGKKK